MKKFFILLCAIVSVTVEAKSQIVVNTTYTNSVKFHNKENTIDGKANLSLTKVSANIPLSKNISDDYKSIKTWHYFISGSYLNVNTISGNEFPTDRVVNIYTGITHYRTLSNRWDMMFYGGAGICQDDSRFSQFRGSDIMGFLIATAIYKVNKNFQIGGGLIFSNAYRDLLIVPTLYFKWKTNDKYFVDLETRTFDFNGEAGMNVNSHLVLSLHSEYNRVGTAIDISNGKDQYFSYNYFNNGLKANFKMNKHLSVPVEVGVSAAGTATYKNRNLKSVFKKSTESYSMDAAPYGSIGVKYDL